MLLGNYPRFETNDADEVEAWLQTNANARIIAIAGASLLPFWVRSASFNSVSLIVSGAAAATEFAYGPADYVRHIFVLEGRSQIFMDATTIETSDRGPGYLIPRDSAWTKLSDEHCESLSVRIDQNTLVRKLEALLGRGVNGAIDFLQPSDGNRLHLSLLKQTIFQFANEMNSAGRFQSPLVMAELEQALIVRFLLFNRHQYSYLFEEIPVKPSTRQLKQIEDYIYENWDQPLDVETLAAVANVSARSVFRHFKKIYGYSPQEFIQRVRLKRARVMLLDQGSSASVMSIALKCGFQSTGYFARVYRQHFGELPSDTLRASSSLRDSSIRQT